MTEADLIDFTSEEGTASNKSGQTIAMPPFASSEYSSGTDTQAKKHDRLVLAGAATVVLAAAGTMSGAFEKASQEVGDLSEATVQKVEDTYNTLKMPIDGALDLAGKLIPDEEPDKARIPNYILKGKVEIDLSKDLKVRQNPRTTGKADSPNEMEWDDVKLANKKIVNNKVVYEPIKARGDKLIVTNPELVVGQYTGGAGNNKGPMEKLWIQLYTEDGGSVFVNFQGQTREFVHEIKKDSSTPSQFIKAETLQNSHGVTLVRYDQHPPDLTSVITISPSGR